MPAKARPIRVLQVIGGMNCGGAETLLMEIYRTLDHQRIQFDFAVDALQPCYYDDEIARLGGRIFRLPHPANGLKRYYQALRRLLEREGPFDAVHSHVHYFGGFVLWLASRAHIPLRLAHSHTTGSLPGSWRERVYRAAMQRLLRRYATHMLGCSRLACEALFGLPPGASQRIRHLPNAINLQRHEELPRDRTALRQRLQLPAEALLIGHVGRFNPEKNHAFLLEVFEHVLAIQPQAELILVGDGPLRPALEAHVRDKGLSPVVHCLGVRDDVPAILAALDLFLFPSRYEGLGIALIEAQAAGLPCLVSDAIPPEADVGLGLVQCMSLQAPAAAWAQQLAALQLMPRPPWHDRQHALQTAGYDLRLLVDQLSRWYTGFNPPPLTDIIL